MKKVLSVILAFAMLLSVIGVSAAPVAEKLDATSIVNVTGKVENGTYVNLLLLDGNDNVKHVQEAKPDKDGNYRVKFKFVESTDGLKLAVKQGNADVTDSVISAIAESQAFTYTFGATTLKDSTLAVAEFENYFNVTGKTYVLMVAFYDKSEKLISVKTADRKTVDFDATSSELELDIPEDTAKVKAFMWDSVEKMIPLAKEKTTKPLKDINILAIGNSFTDDPTAYLVPLAKADGVTLNLTRALHSGSSIKQHWDSYKTQTPFYGSGESQYTLDHYLDPAQNGNKYYDYVIFQQVSQDSGLLKTYGFDEYDPDNEYDNCAENIAKVIREFQPTAEIVLQQTWAYETGYGRLSIYGGTREKMHDAIVNAVSTACELLAKVETEGGDPISLDGKPLRYIPVGEAFQNARKAPMFDTKFDSSKLTEGTAPNNRYPAAVVSLHRDGFHSSSLYGRYLGAIVWYGALTGNSPVANKYEHKITSESIEYTLKGEAKAILKKAAQDALDSYGLWN